MAVKIAAVIFSLLTFLIHSSAGILPSASLTRVEMLAKEGAFAYADHPQKNAATIPVTNELMSSEYSNIFSSLIEARGGTLKFEACFWSQSFDPTSVGGEVVVAD
jgi:hypothetical protein